MSVKSKYFILFVLALSSGCTHISTLSPSSSAPTEVAPRPGAIGNIINNYNENPETTDEVTEIGYEVEPPDLNENEAVSMNGDGKTSNDDDMALQYHPKHFTFWQNYFTAKGKERFERQLARGEKYRELIQNVFEEHGLPKDLFYIGLIESGYALSAKSHASAVGPWQFIKGTATRYGLKVNNAIDERRNIHKATVAAAGYFRDLYNIFGSWELALCAYNAGEYRIINAIRKGGTRDYKELVTKKLIPKETIYYVPKMAAARDISKKRESFGLNIPKVSPQESNFYANAITYEMSGTYSLMDVAKFSKASHEHLVLLNPDLNHQRIGATTRSKMRVILPSGKIGNLANFQSTQEREPANRVVVKSIKNTKSTPVNYVVRKGDNLSTIARKFKVSVNDIKKYNNLRTDRLLVGRSIKIPNDRRMKVYVVRRGDSLERIARQFNTTIRDIVALNSLSSNRIFPQQKLQIPSGS